MLIEKIALVIYSVSLIWYLFYKFFKSYAPENLAIAIFSIISTSTYIIFVCLDIFIPIYAQVLILLFSAIIPRIEFVLQTINISLAKKVLYVKMKYYYDSKDYKLTIKYINKLVLLDGRKNETMYILGMCYKALKDLESAKKAFEFATELDEKDYKSYTEWGTILDSEGKKEAALIMFDKALKINPNSYEAREALGICLTSQGRFMEAIIVYKEAVKIHKDSYEMFYNIGMLEEEVENFEEAEMAFEEVERLKPEFLIASYNIGELALKRGDYVKAINEYKKVVSSMTYGTKAYYKIAVCYALLKEYEKAISLIEYVIEVDSSYIRKMSMECAFLPIRERLNEYILDREVRLAEESEKKNYMKDKIIKFFKKDNSEIRKPLEDEEDYSQNFKIVK